MRELVLAVGCLLPGVGVAGCLLGEEATQAPPSSRPDVTEAPANATPSDEGAATGSRPVASRRVGP